MVREKTTCARKGRTLQRSKGQSGKKNPTYCLSLRDLILPIQVAASLSKVSFPFSHASVIEVIATSWKVSFHRLHLPLRSPIQPPVALRRLHGYLPRRWSGWICFHHPPRPSRSLSAHIASAHISQHPRFLAELCVNDRVPIRMIRRISSFFFFFFFFDPSGRFTRLPGRSHSIASTFHSDHRSSHL